jgi:hypothetical protein
MPNRTEITTFSDEEEDLKAKLVQRGYRVQVFKTDSPATPFHCKLVRGQGVTAIEGRTVLDALANAVRHTAGK